MLVLCRGEHFFLPHPSFRQVGGIIFTPVSALAGQAVNPDLHPPTSRVVIHPDRQRHAKKQSHSPMLDDPFACLGHMLEVHVRRSCPSGKENDPPGHQNTGLTEEEDDQKSYVRTFVVVAGGLC